MQQKDELSQRLPSSAVRERPLRERVGVYIQARDTVDAITRIREAERAGVQQAWMAMGGAGFADILTVLAIATTQTERIKLGTAIVPASPRHPLVMAQQALAVHDFAPERLRLGIGSGNRAFLEGRYGLSQTAPLRYLKEYVEVLRGVLWQGRIDHQGEFFQVVDTLPRTAQVPLLIPALGLKAFRLAGEIADGALASLCPVPYLLDQALPALRAGAEEKSRPAPPVVACLPIAFSTNEVAVLVAVRQFVQQLIQTSTYAHMFSLAGWAAAVDGDETALHALARTLVISGDETTVRDRVQELLASGLDELLLLAIPIVDEAMERKQLLHLIGSL
ncbi:LLM class flavin-dependent oxidoreductase [Ktedonosporobacter rubrisoli]|uniref:LLM class flavin-dependent oxidoreductase n=1 Tax=Ktedonosporobacter rubrisoli TaxID=2509675 RepID=A0A4P6JVJ0_KTERU|nr:LLM class flavin-dependent oxidoreductase [Ktedonosporobacter rubrisoli]QBD79688.1 LLM class flavin-dependent oxidoreductase [Ktedonosporobacter rubrisoli]